MSYTIYSPHAPYRGFTLVEMLVVVSIVALLATAGVNQFRQAGAEARDAQRKAVLHELTDALELFYVQTGCYPSDVFNRDTSVGWGGRGTGAAEEDTFPNHDGWHPEAGLRELQEIGILSEMPADPLNNASFYIGYEPHCTVPSYTSPPASTPREDAENRWSIACMQGYELMVNLETGVEPYRIHQGVQDTDPDCEQCCGFVNINGHCR